MPLRWRSTRRSTPQPLAALPCSGRCESSSAKRGMTSFTSRSVARRTRSVLSTPSGLSDVMRQFASGESGSGSRRTSSGRSMRQNMVWPRGARGRCAVWSGSSGGIARQKLSR